MNLGEGVSGEVRVRLIQEEVLIELEIETFRLDLIEESMITPRNVFFRGAEISIIDGFVREDQI